jgi:hypothetical protein
VHDNKAKIHRVANKYFYQLYPFVDCLVVGGAVILASNNRDLLVIGRKLLKNQLKLTFLGGCLGLRFLGFHLSLLRAKPMISKNTFIIALLSVYPCFAFAVTPDSSAINNQTDVNSESVEAFRARAQNPLSSRYSLPFKYTYHGSAPNGGVSVWSLQPIFTLGMGQNWNLVNQMSLNFADTPGGVNGIAEIPNPYVKKPLEGPKGATGLADLNLTSLVTPANPKGSVRWGLGTSITFPTDAPSRELGSGKFSIGPAATILQQTKDWTVGLQASQIWSAFGNQERTDVSQLQLKPMLNYNLGESWYLSSNMVIVSNWNKSGNQQWTVPVGGGVGKVFDLGEHKLNTRLESYYNTVRPDQSPSWTVGATVQLMFPK